jgi:hypothetical protein
VTDRILFAVALLVATLAWLDEHRLLPTRELRRSYVHRGRHHGRRRVSVPRARLHAQGTGRACLVDTVAAWWAVDAA